MNQRLELILHSGSTYYFTIKSDDGAVEVVENGFIEIVKPDERKRIPDQLENMEQFDLYKSWSKEIVYCVYLESSNRSCAVIDICSEAKPKFEVTRKRMKKE